LNILQSWPYVPALLAALAGLAVAVRSMVLLFAFLITVRRLTPTDRLVAFRVFVHAADGGRNTMPSDLGQSTLYVESDDNRNEPNAGITQNELKPPGPTVDAR